MIYEGKKSRLSATSTYSVTHTHTHTCTGQTDHFSFASVLSGPGGAQRPPHLSPRPATDLAAASTSSRSHESSSINVNHQAFPRRFHHSTPLLSGVPSGSVLGPMTFAHRDKATVPLAQLGEASQRYYVCFVKRDRESIQQSGQRRCSNLSAARRLFRRF